MSCCTIDSDIDNLELVLLVVVDPFTAPSASSAPVWGWILLDTTFDGLFGNNESCLHSVGR